MAVRPGSNRAERRPLRVLVALAALSLALVAAGPTSVAHAGPAAPVQGTPGESANTGDSAILDLVGCIQGSNQLIAVFLFDESQSLQLTDPDNQRVEAARAALDGLNSLTERAGATATTVDVALAGFSNRYRPVLDWTSVTSANAKALEAGVKSFERRTNGIDTDFVNALSGARDALAARSAVITEQEGATAPCKAIFFFTDGEYDIQVRTPETVERLGRTKTYAPGVALDTEAGVNEAETAGRAELCREGGLADGIRSDDITLLSVALAEDTQSEAQKFLAAVSAGSAGDVSCGAPVGSAPGAYLAASDVDVLVARFDEVAARVAGGTLVSGENAVTLCDGKPCDEGSRELQLDASVRRLRVLALAAEPGIEVEVSGPNGSTRITEAGTTEIGNVKLTAARVAGRGLSIELDRPDELGDWTGSWTVAAVTSEGDQAGKPATLQIYLFSDFGVTVDATVALVRGKTATLSAQVEVPEGIDAEQLLASGSATMRLDDPISNESTTVKLTGPAVGPFTGTFDVPSDFTTSAYSASVELKATTKDGGVVAAQSAPELLTVLRPEGSIQLQPNVLDLPTLTGDGTTNADLVLAGGSGPGCVWFDAPVPAAPADAGRIVVTLDGNEAIDEASCIPVPAGETVTLPVEVSPSARGTGAVRGVLEINTKVEGGEANLTRLPYRFDLSAGINQVRRLAFAVLLLLAGLAIPLGLLILINSLTARFQSLDVVQGAVVPILVSSQQVFRTDSGRAVRLSLRPADFTSMRGSGERKHFTFGGVHFRAMASRNPFGSTAAMAAPEGGAEKLKGRAGSHVELDPSLAGSWIFLLDPDRTRRSGKGNAEGDLIAFLSEGDASQQLRKMQGDMDVRLARTAAELAGLVRGKKRRTRRPSKNRAGAEPVANAEPGDTDAPADPAESADPLGSATGPVNKKAGSGDPKEGAASAPAGFTGGASSATSSPGATPDAPTQPTPTEEPPPGAPRGFTGSAPPSDS